MEKQTTSQSIKQAQSLKTAWAIVVCAIVTALTVGGGIYFWQNSKLKTSEQKLQKRIVLLQNKLTQIQNENNISKTKTPVNNTTYNLINNLCTINECLFNRDNSNYPLGIAIIKGYYSPVERSAWGETKKCDSFTITGGSKELIRAMVNLVDIGNTVHSKNELNQPVINLGLGLISQSEKQSILDSTVNNQIELIVLSESPLGMGVPACFQDVIVLRKK